RRGPGPGGGVTGAGGVGDVVVDEGGGQRERHGAAGPVGAVVVDDQVGVAVGGHDVGHAVDGAGAVGHRDQRDRGGPAGRGGQAGRGQAPALVAGEGPGGRDGGLDDRQEALDPQGGRPPAAGVVDDDPLGRLGDGGPVAERQQVAEGLDLDGDVP